MPDQPRVRVDQDLCTGDGLCAQHAPEVFELDIDGLAYAKGADGKLRAEPGAYVDVPVRLWPKVVQAAAGCPSTCIHLDPPGH